MSREGEINLSSPRCRAAFELGIATTKIPFQLNELWRWSLEDVTLPPLRTGVVRDDSFIDYEQVLRSPIPAAPTEELAHFRRQVDMLLRPLELRVETAERILEAIDHLVTEYRNVWGTDTHRAYRREFLTADSEASASLHLGLYHTADGKGLDPTLRLFVSVVLNAVSSLTCPL
jgi:hypothetical protein